MLRFLRRRRNEEAGAITVMVAVITCFVLIPLAALAVDIGVQRVARRDVQAVADVVALDLARQLDGRDYGELKGSIQTLADKSAARNRVIGSAVPSVAPEYGTIDTEAWDPADPEAYFTPADGDDVVPNAVRVRASTSVDFQIESGSGGAVRTAIATARAEVCYSTGSFALNLNSSKSALLNALVGDALDLSAISYTGLADADVSLLGLATELGVGSVDGLLALDNLSLADLFLASAEALQAEGGDTADINLLNQLALSVGALPPIAFGDLIALTPGDNSALTTTVNLLDLVSGSAFLANGENALAVPNLTVGVPNVAGVTTSLKIIQKPIKNCTRQPQQTSQIDLDVHVDLANIQITVIPLLLVVGASTDIDLSLDIAHATTTRTNAFCGDPEGVDVSVASGLASLSLDTVIGLGSLATATLSTSTSAPPATNTVQFRHPPDGYGDKKSVGSSAILPTLSSTDVNIQLLPGFPLPPLVGVNAVLSGLLSGVVSGIVTPILNPLISNLNSLLLTPLTQLLGVNMGGADLYFNEPPTCNNPVLAG